MRLIRTRGPYRLNKVRTEAHKKKNRKKRFYNGYKSGKKYIEVVYGPVTRGCLLV
jgi:hypothetical protein